MAGIDLLAPDERAEKSPTDERGHGALRNYLYQFMKSIPVPVVLLSPGGTVTDVNPAFLEELVQGRSEKRAWIGRRFLDCVAESRPRIEDPLADVLARKPVSVPRMQIRCGDCGAPATVSFHGAPMFNAKGEQEGALLVLTNVTGQESLETRLAQAQKMEAIGRLAGGIAHDFNNLLTGILGYASLLKASLPAASEEFEAAYYIERAAKRAAEVTRQLLAYSRRETAISRPLNANRIINEAIDILSRSVNKNVRISADFRAARPTILGDPTALVQALMNLGVNANDAMPGGGALTFFTRDVASDGTRSIQGIPVAKGDYLSIRVSDTGSGIPETIKNKIFEPFFTTKEPGRGTGLGLSMVYGCVKSHNGYIFIDSREGEGTTFELLLPSTDRGEEEQQDRQPEAPLLHPGTETVLVIDDEEIPLRLACDMLRTLGYTALPAPSGEEGLEVIRINPAEIDAVILDKIMPGMDGTETLRHIREIAPDARVILSSGYVDGLAGNPDLLRKFDGFLPKPYKMEELARMLRKVLDESGTS
ncbi:MAG: response regulator [Deltaproteobacteria bacterium]|nr:response regulator [Deltaproteobacteria bacterium]